MAKRHSWPEPTDILNTNPFERKCSGNITKETGCQVVMMIRGHNVHITYSKN